MSDNHPETRTDGLFYDEAGGGTPIVLLHCGAGSSSNWGAVSEDLSTTYRILAPDLLGYGRNQPWPRDADLTRDSELVNVAALFDIAGEPVHLVGHSYGGTVAINAAKRFPERIASLTLIEPVAFQLLKAAGRPDEWGEIVELANRHLALTAEGRDMEAAEAFITYWTTTSTWRHISAAMRENIARTMTKIAAEWRLMFRVENDLGQIAAIMAPTLLICGGLTVKPARQVIETLRLALPRASYLEIADAGHMSPLTHPAAVADAIRAHIASVGAQAILPLST
jgi:pimeloyl-ACP methyl ester carboxylesterase